MARSKHQPATATVERPQYASPDISLPDPPPQYASVDSVLAEPDLSEIQEIARNASYLLLDERGGEIQLLAHGVLGGAVIRTFGSLEEGVGFVKAAGIQNCRCLKLPEGVVR